MKISRKWGTFLLVLFITLIFQLTEGSYVKAATISISSRSLTLSVNTSKTLSVLNTTKKVTWSSSNITVAQVSSTGTVTAKIPGSATIYATVNGIKLFCKVTVVKINPSLATLAVGSTKTLSVVGTNSTITWSSSNSSIATISSTGKVTAKAPGTATIYALVNGKKISSKVTVVKISASSTTLTVGKTKTLSVTGTTNTITWYSSNKSVVTVSSLGIVTAKMPGTATIYAVVNGLKLSSKFNIIPSKKVVGYYAAWSRYAGFTPDKLDAMKLTSINYAFANISSDNKIILGYPDVDVANINQLNQLKNIHHDLKTVISVGGWSWSGRFSNVAQSEESRNTFADSCVDFILKYGFNGIDIDWEYPVSGGLPTNVRRPEDKTNFTLLLKTLREKLNEQGAIDGKKYLLTFAGAAGNWYLKNIELAEINKYVDYAYVMTYDIHGSWEPYTNFNAPLYSNDPLQPYKISVDLAINDWLNAGFPKNKMIMGVPFYGFIYNAVTNLNQGLYQTYSGCASISYANTVANYLGALGYIRYFHEASKVPYLYNGSTFITYEDEQSMKEKANYINNKNLGGAMIWELSQDPNKILLNSLYRGLK